MLQKNGFDQFQSNTTGKLPGNPLSERVTAPVFADHMGGYLHLFNLYLCHFNTIPSVYTEPDINCQKAVDRFVATYPDMIIAMYSNERRKTVGNKTDKQEIFVVLKNKLMLYFDFHCCKVKILYDNRVELVDEIIVQLRKTRKKKERRKPTICLLIQGRHGIETKSLTISRPKLGLNDNYNDDLKEVHQAILRRLSKKNEKGLVLLHGKPGTGKTSYIRYLAATIKKPVIFLPPEMAGSIVNPSLVPVLIENPDSILVIEDAENIIACRDRNDQSPVSVLLNIADGLLSDCLNIQLICSFNTDISKIDNALLRKGRLIARYEFKELEMHKARALSEKLGFKNEITIPMLLTDIYRQEERSYMNIQTSKRVGFRAGN